MISIVSVQLWNRSKSLEGWIRSFAVKGAADVQILGQMLLLIWIWRTWNLIFFKSPALSFDEVVHQLIISFLVHHYSFFWPNRHAHTTRAGLCIALDKTVWGGTLLVLDDLRRLKDELFAVRTNLDDFVLLQDLPLRCKEVLPLPRLWTYGSFKRLRGEVQWGLIDLWNCLILIEAAIRLLIQSISSIKIVDLGHIRICCAIKDDLLSTWPSTAHLIRVAAQMHAGSYIQVQPRWRNIRSTLSERPDL